MSKNEFKRWFESWEKQIKGEKLVTEEDVADFLLSAGPKTIGEVCDHFRISKDEAGRLLCKALKKGWVSKEKVKLLGNLWRYKWA